MTKALNPAFFGKTVPLAGQRKQSLGSTITRLIKPELERLPDGRYLQTQSMQNRCCIDMEVGSRLVYVMDDHGYLSKSQNGGEHGIEPH